MDQDLDSIADQVRSGRNFDSPPLHLWHPPLSGDIAIRINREGQWFHEGDPIRRESLVRLFASILRREDDGEYYLVTPAEKWRIQVELHPLIVTDVDRGEGVVQLSLNNGKTLELGQEHPLFLEPAVGDIAAVSLWHGLAALFSRAAWYRLIELADERDGAPGIESNGEWYSLAP
jgi:hypothetical protein